MKIVKCDCCGSNAEWVLLSEVSKEYKTGFAWACKKCNTWVKCKDDDPYEPDGKLKNPKIKIARNNLNAIIKALMMSSKKLGKGKIRGYLAKKFNIPRAKFSYNRLDLEQIKFATKCLLEYKS